LSFCGIAGSLIAGLAFDINGNDRPAFISFAVITAFTAFLVSFLKVLSFISRPKIQGFCDFLLRFRLCVKRRMQSSPLWDGAPTVVTHPGPRQAEGVYLKRVCAPPETLHNFFGTDPLKKSEMLQNS